MVILTGDTHQDFDRLGKMSLYYHFTKKDFVIVLGDFGLLWDNVSNKLEINLIRFLNDLPFTILFLDGNHENFARINSLKTIGLFKGRAGRISNSIFHLKRGEIYEIDGVKIFTFGGGLSIDKAIRTEYINWWKEEEPNFSEMKNGLDNLKLNDWKVDYILTHECPEWGYRMLSTMFKMVKSSNYQLPKYLEEIRTKVDFKHWYFGHHHINIDLNDKITCLYTDFIELGDKHDRT